jgi:hypothetical protein
MFGKHVFDELVVRFPRVSLAIDRELAQRLAAANQSAGMPLEHLRDYQPTWDVIHLLPTTRYVMILKQTRRTQLNFTEPKNFSSLLPLLPL